MKQTTPIGIQKWLFPFKLCARSRTLNDLRECPSFATRLFDHQTSHRLHNARDANDPKGFQTGDASQAAQTPGARMRGQGLC